MGRVHPQQYHQWYKVAPMQQTSTTYVLAVLAVSDGCVLMRSEYQNTSITKIKILAHRMGNANSNHLKSNSKHETKPNFA